MNKDYNRVPVERGVIQRLTRLEKVNDLFLKILDFLMEGGLLFAFLLMALPMVTRVNASTEDFALKLFLAVLLFLFYVAVIIFCVTGNYIKKIRRKYPDANQHPLNNRML